MAASAHIYPTTQTRLAGELITLVRAMRDIDKDAPQFKTILDQVASGANFANLASELGLGSDTQAAENAEAVYNLLGSLVVELANSPFWKQVISRMG